MWSALGAIAIHAACVVLAFAYLQPDEDDEALGATAIEIGVEFAAIRAEATDLPPGPDAEASAASPAVVEQKSHRLDQVDPDGEACGEPQQRAGILRDVGLVEGKTQIEAPRFASARRERDYRDGHSAAFAAVLCGSLSHSSASSTV